MAEPGNQTLVVRPSDSPLRAAATFAYALAFLTAIGAVALGYHLITDQVGYSHPHVGAGWAVVLGGLVQASLIALISRSAQVTAHNRDQIRALLVAMGDPK